MLEAKLEEHLKISTAQAVFRHLGRYENAVLIIILAVLNRISCGNSQLDEALGGNLPLEPFPEAL